MSLIASLAAFAAAASFAATAAAALAVSIWSCVGCGFAGDAFAASLAALAFAPAVSTLLFSSVETVATSPAATCLDLSIMTPPALTIATLSASSFSCIWSITL